MSINRHMLRLVASAAVLGMTAGPALAQEEAEEAQAETGERLLLVHVVLDPGSAGAADDAWRAMMEQAQAGGYDMPIGVYGWNFNRWTVSPFGEDYAGLDAMFDARGEAVGDNEAFAEVYDTYLSAIVESDSMILQFEPELSLNPDTAAPDDYGYLEVAKFDVDSGRDDEMREVLADVRDFYEALEVDYGYRIYAGGIGDPGTYWAVSYADDRAAYVAREAEIEAAMTDAEGLEALGERFYDVISGETTIMMRPMRDMNFPPPADDEGDEDDSSE